MTPSTRHRLLEDTLHPDALAESLAATRRSARHRRIFRRTARTGAVAMGLGAAAWLGFIRPRPSAVVDRPTDLVSPSIAQSRPPHRLVTTEATAGPLRVRTTPSSTVSPPPPRATPGVLIVSTRSHPSVVPRATEDDLFAAAGPRPAALHRLPDGTAKWVWLDRDAPW